jgi:hypothetical protein
MPMYDMIVVPRFDGGLNTVGSPIGLQDHEWSWSDGFEPINGCAQQMSVWQSVDLGTWPVSGTTPIGVVEDNQALNLTALFVFSRTTATGAIRVWRYEADVDDFIEQTVSGTWQAASTARLYQRPIVIGGKQLFCAGTSGTLSQNTCAAYTPGSPGTATVIAPTTPLRGWVQVAAANHGLVFGDTYSPRIVRVSDAGALGTGTDWNPTIANTADELTLDAGLWRGAAPTTQGVVILYENLGFLMSPTGSDPPFTVATIGTAAGAVGLQQITECPAGTVFLTRKGYATLGGGILPGSEKCSNLIAPQYSSQLGTLKLVYDNRRNALLSVGDGASYGDPVQTFFQPSSGAWFRRLLPTPGTGTPVDHGYAKAATASLDYWLLWSTGSALYHDTYEIGSADGHTNAFIDTKDFAYPSPSSNDYTDFVQIDWEDIGSGTQMEVYAYSRDELIPVGYQVTETGELDFTSSFVLLGTISETDRLPMRVRLKGRYIRFRFKITTGRARIRGLSIRRLRGSENSAGFTLKG